MFFFLVRFIRFDLCCIFFSLHIWMRIFGVRRLFFYIDKVLTTTTKNAPESKKKQKYIRLTNCNRTEKKNCNSDIVKSTNISVFIIKNTFFHLSNNSFLLNSPFKWIHHTITETLAYNLFLCLTFDCFSCGYFSCTRLLIK